MTMQQMAHQRKTHTHREKMGCHKMAHQENQALQNHSPEKIVGKQARRQG
jgi:hypothetical protein